MKISLWRDHYFQHFHFLRAGKKKKKNRIYAHADNTEKVAWSLLAFVKQGEMFPTVYRIEISLINPMIQCLSQATASEKTH